MDALKIIPQAFFDLIARVVPGTLAICLAYILFEDSWKVSTVYKLAPMWEASPIVFLLVFSFMLGHIISPLTKRVQKGLKPLQKNGEFASIKYEWLRLYQPDVGGLCTKLRSEFSMYNSFSAVFLIFFTLEIAQGFLFDSIHFIIAATLFILAFIFERRGKEAEDTFQKNVVNFYTVAKDPIIPVSANEKIKKSSIQDEEKNQK